MAWSGWNVLASSAAWGSGPNITAKFEYAYQRSGADMQYKVRITVNTLPYSSSYFGYPIYATIKLDGTTKVSGHQIKAGSPAQWPSAIVYTTDVLTAAGKTSGTTQLIINLYSGSGESRSVNYTYSLSVAPAASNVDSVSNISTGSAVSVKWTPRNKDFTFNLIFKIGSKTIKSATGIRPGSTSQYVYTGYTIPHSEIPNAGSSSVTVTLETYSGSTRVGSDTKTFTASVPSSVVPTAGNLAVISENEVSLLGTEFAAGLSCARWSCNASAGDGAAIREIRFAFADQEQLGTAGSGTTDIIGKAGAYAPTVTVTDSRGRKATLTGESIEVLPYLKPSASGAAVKRCDSLGNEDEEGTYICVQVTATYSDLNGRNAATLRVRTRSVGGAWSGYTTILDGTLNVMGTFAIERSYEVEISIADSVGNTGLPLTFAVPTSEVAFHLRDGGKGAAFGKYSEKDALECAWPAEFGDDVEVDGSLKVGGKTLLDFFHPVGSIYESTNPTSPEILFGGTWEQIKDRFLLAAGDTYAAGATGGEAMHTLTVAEMPAHTHPYKYNGQSLNVSTSGIRLTDGDKSNAYSGSPNGAAGGNQPHNNMPPYVTVYMWKRTA